MLAAEIKIASMPVSQSRKKRCLDLLKPLRPAQTSSPLNALTTIDELKALVNVLSPPSQDQP